MDMHAIYRNWWDSLCSDERIAIRCLGGAPLPEQVAFDLLAVGIAVVEADMPTIGHTYLMPTSLLEFVRDPPD